jgi:membrane protein
MSQPANQPSKRHYFRGMITLTKYVYRRIAEERLTQVAGNITYTLILGLVPALVVALAILTRFPHFEILQKTLKFYFMRGMIPPGMAQSIHENLTSFAANATHVSIISSLVMVFTTVMMFDLVENTFNRIWGVQESRPVIRRAFIYFFIAILGPLLLGGSLYLASHLFLAARGIIGQSPWLRSAWFAFFLCAISTLIFTCLYRFVPYRHVLWRDAFRGALFAAISFDVAKRLFAAFVMQFAAYREIYGALAAIPLFLLWLYISSLIMLSGAVLASSLPDFRSGRWRRTVMPGSQYADVLLIIRKLYDAETEENASVGWTHLQRLVSLSSAELEGILLTMQHLGWVKHIRQHPAIPFVRRRKNRQRTLDEWKWSGDAQQITLADVYIQFVFQPDETSGLSRRIANLLQDNLNQSLTDYFEEPGRNEPLTAIHGFS